jgi:hypothetical protein
MTGCESLFAKPSFIGRLAIMTGLRSSGGRFLPRARLRFGGSDRGKFVIWAEYGDYLAIESSGISFAQPALE